MRSSLKLPDVRLHGRTYSFALITVLIVFTCISSLLLFISHISSVVYDGSVLSRVQRAFRRGDACSFRGETGFTDIQSEYAKWGNADTKYMSCQFQRDQPGFSFTSLRADGALVYNHAACPTIPTLAEDSQRSPWTVAMAGTLIGPAEFTLGIRGKVKWHALNTTQNKVFDGFPNHEYVFARCRVVYPNNTGPEYYRYAMNAHTRIVPHAAAIHRSQTSASGTKRARPLIFPGVVVLEGESQTRTGMRTHGPQASTCLMERFGPGLGTAISEGAYTFFDFKNYRPAGQYTVHNIPGIFSGRDYVSLPGNCSTCMFELFKKNGFITWGSDSHRFHARSSIGVAYANGAGKSGKRPKALADMTVESILEEPPGGFGQSDHWFQDMTQTELLMCNKLDKMTGKCSYCDAYSQMRHHCYGPKLIEEYSMSHLLQFLRAYSKDIPKFAFHSNDGNHWCNKDHGKGWRGNANQVYNEGSYTIHLFLSELLNDFGPEELPLIIIVGDHGPGIYDVGSKGHDEVLLELLVPTQVLADHPIMAATLMANQDKLLGPYDIYEALHWIATGYTTLEHPLVTRDKKSIKRMFFTDIDGKQKSLRVTDPLPPLDGSNIPQNIFMMNISAARTPRQAGLPRNVWQRKDVP